MTYLSLFAGIGGGDLGFDRAGLCCVGQVEIDPFCRRVLRRHWPDVPLWDDIRTFDPIALGWERPDVVVFGSPCQDLSVAGRREGLRGGKSVLFFEATRIIRICPPALIVWENVPGALSSNNGDDFAAVIDELADCGALDIAWRVLDSQYFGVPQRRRRVYVAADFGGHRAGEILFEPEGGCGNPAPIGTPGTDTARALTGSTGGASGKESQHTFVIQAVANAVTARDGKGADSDCTTTMAYQTLRTNMRNNSNPSTEAGMLVFGAAASVRRLTPRECERLQGFPDGWTCICGANGEYGRCSCPDSPRYRALGNAMTVNVMEWIGRRMAAVV
jgi:DNA (cytosine-5)-methyltransferase 1